MNKTNEAPETSVLLIEDNSADIHFLKEILSEDNHFTFKLEVAIRLAKALEHLDRKEYGIALLDLSLPDSQGLETFDRVHSCAPHTPIIILTATDDDALAMEAVRLGAQDYLVKGQIDCRLLIRAIRYALERNKNELELIRQQQQMEREIRSLQRIAGRPSATITAQTFGLKLLRDHQPAMFNELTAIYSELLERAMEKRSYRVEHDISGALRSLAERLGELKLGPREVVEIYTAALTNQTSGVNAKKAGVYVDEGRLILLELMGFLAAYYRNYSLYFAEVQGVTNVEIKKG